MAKKVSPLIKPKPMKAREMKTQAVPSEMLDTMKLVSSRKNLDGVVSELERPKDDKVELYHEGYVDDKLYLVPDENLDVMADDVNTQLRLRGFRDMLGENDDRQKKIDDFKSAHHKLRSFHDKVSFLNSSESSVSSASEEKETQEDEVKLIWESKEEELYDLKTEEWEPKEEQVKGPIMEEKHEVEVNDEKIEEEPMEEQATGPIEKEEPQTNEKQKGHLKENREWYPNRLRLLISGHLRKDQKPIYLIQQFSEGLDIFREQKADFQRSQRLSDSGMEASVTGRFYDRTILEEAEGLPVALNVTPNRILVDRNKTNVYDERFEQKYSLQTVDVILTGEFLRSDVNNSITPFLSLSIEEVNPPEETDENSDFNKSSTTVFTCRFNPTQPFSEEI